MTPLALLTQQPQRTRVTVRCRRHADHGRELRQNQRAEPHPSGSWPLLPRAGAGVPTFAHERRLRSPSCVCSSARPGARRAHSRRRASVVDALLGDLLRWRRVLLHWYPRSPGSCEEFLTLSVWARPAQHKGHRVLAGAQWERVGHHCTPAPCERRKAWVVIGPGSHAPTHAAAGPSKRNAPPLGSSCARRSKSAPAIAHGEQVPSIKHMFLIGVVKVLFVES